MKKYIFLTLCFAFATAGVSAQSTDGSMQNGQAMENAQARAKDATDRINAVAQLTQAQYASVLQINRSFFSRARSGGAGAGAARLEAWREQQIRGAIFPDQYQKVQDSGVLHD